VIVGKVNRNNHPILVKARKASFDAGKEEGYREGYRKGFADGYEKSKRCVLKPYEAQIECLKTIIAGFEAKEDVQSGRGPVDKTLH
jgi:flagellar biosynthesis/type III secretory pathway protein FliH